MAVPFAPVCEATACRPWRPGLAGAASNQATHVLEWSDGRLSYYCGRHEDLLQERVASGLALRVTRLPVPA